MKLVGWFRTYRPRGPDYVVLLILILPVLGAALRTRDVWWILGVPLVYGIATLMKWLKTEERSRLWRTCQESGHDRRHFCMRCGLNLSSVTPTSPSPSESEALLREARDMLESIYRHEVQWVTITDLMEKIDRAIYGEEN